MKSTSLGWVLLPGTRTLPDTRVHRPHPDRPLSTFCGRVLGGRSAVLRRPPGIRACARCEQGYAVRRRKQKVLLARELEARRAANGRTHGRSSSSVRALRGGLPGLGRRR